MGEGITKRGLLKGIAGIALSLDAILLDNLLDNPKNSLAQSGGTNALNHKVRNAVLEYMSNPKFINANFLEQISGTKAKLQLYVVDNGMLYFSLPSNENWKESLKRLTRNPNNVQFGKVVGDGLILDEYTLRQPGAYFFRFPADDFLVNPKSNLDIKYPSAQYQITLQELADFLADLRTYNGPLFADTGLKTNGRKETIANHGAFVAMPNEPSLERLVKQLVPYSSRKEQTAQRLLDFVTNEIEYDGRTEVNNVETLKRPNEVLMTKIDDCSGKVILYTSLLEQVGVDYRLFYVDTKGDGSVDHITVAVEGNFKDLNGMSFKIGDKPYAIAETTAEGFRIGTSILNKRISLDNIKYMHRPGRETRIYNVKTRKPLEWA